MELYVASSNDAILEGAALQKRSLEGQIWATIPVKTQPAPTKEPTKEAAPTEEPNEEAAPMEDPTEEAAPQRFLLRWWTPQRFLPKRHPLQRSPLRNQLPQQPPSVSQQKSQIFTLCGLRREREKFPIVISLAGWRYCILPGW